MFRLIGQVERGLASELLLSTDKYTIFKECPPEGSRYRLLVGEKYFMIKLSEIAHVIFVDEHKIKNRFGPSVNLSTKDVRGYFIFWDDENSFLKFDSKAYERSDKIEKILQ